MLHLFVSMSLFEDAADISRRTDCMEEYIKKGIAMACFYYARCLSLGRGVQLDEDEAKKFYSRVSIQHRTLLHLYVQGGPKITLQ